MTWWAFIIRTSLPVEQSRGGLLAHCATVLCCRQEEALRRLFSVFLWLVWMCANNYLPFSCLSWDCWLPSGLAYFKKISFKYNQGCLSPEQSRAGMIDRGIKGGTPATFVCGAECWLASTGHGLCGGDSRVGFSPACRGQGSGSEAVPALQEMRKWCVWRGTLVCLLWQPRVPAKARKR